MRIKQNTLYALTMKHNLYNRQLYKYDLCFRIMKLRHTVHNSNITLKTTNIISHPIII